MSQNRDGFRVPREVMEAMWRQAASGADAPRPAAPVPSDPEEEAVAEEFMADDPTLSNRTLADMERQVFDLSGFISNQVNIRQSLEAETKPGGDDELSASRRYGLLSDMMEVEAQLGRVMRLLGSISTTERRHYSEKMGDAMIEVAKRKRAKMNDELAEALAEEEKDGHDDSAE